MMVLVKDLFPGISTSAPEKSGIDVVQVAESWNRVGAWCTMEKVGDLCNTGSRVSDQLLESEQERVLPFQWIPGPQVVRPGTEGNSASKDCEQAGGLTRVCSEIVPVGDNGRSAITNDVDCLVLPWWLVMRLYEIDTSFASCAVSSPVTRQRRVPDDLPGGFV